MTVMEQELHTLPKHPSSSMFFCEIRVAQTLVFCVSLLSFDMPYKIYHLIGIFKVFRGRRGRDRIVVAISAYLH